MDLARMVDKFKSITWCTSMCQRLSPKVCSLRRTRLNDRALRIANHWCMCAGLSS